ncbi:hypothetical protein RchiOBHm_Chr2g0167671 [Rosa chinensis]|uniref:Uncharacterized protein n=1 Tax=Rosa chinensis TaxID=74649 RepID=A0A2P6S4D3_ROSCH|nr:hypothetical protein RchiOBHm_Chr2g0167671 [Rosa chinensis]
MLTSKGWKLKAFDQLVGSISLEKCNFICGYFFHFCICGNHVLYVNFRDGNQLIAIFILCSFCKHRSFHLAFGSISLGFSVYSIAAAQNVQQIRKN